MDLSGIEGVLLLNISSYGGGSDLWGKAGPCEREKSDDERERAGLAANFSRPARPSARSNAAGPGKDKEGKTPHVEKSFCVPSNRDKLIEVISVVIPKRTL